MVVLEHASLALLVGPIRLARLRQFSSEAELQVYQARLINLSIIESRKFFDGSSMLSSLR